MRRDQREAVFIRLQETVEQTRALYEGAKENFERARALTSDLGAAHPDSDLAHALRVYTHTLMNYQKALHQYSRFLLDEKLPHPTNTQLAHYPKSNAPSLHSSSADPRLRLLLAVRSPHRNKPMETESERTLFYVVKRPEGYAVWETTPSNMFERTKQDLTLNARLDRNPFSTRAEAEQRCRELIASQSHAPND